MNSGVDSYCCRCLSHVVSIRNLEDVSYVGFRYWPLLIWLCKNWLFWKEFMRNSWEHLKHWLNLLLNQLKFSFITVQTITVPNVRGQFKISRYHFLVGAFLEKRVDYRHGCSSVFLKLKKKIRYTWSDQNSSTPKVLQNFKKLPNCTRWPNELSQKGFPRKYNTGRDLSVFSALRDFFFKFFFFIKGSPIHQ